MEDYWKKEKPDYIDLKLRIESIENKIYSGVIKNNITMSIKNREVKMLREKFSKMPKYITT